MKDLKVGCFEIFQIQRNYDFLKFKMPSFFSFLINLFPFLHWKFQAFTWIFWPITCLMRSIKWPMNFLTGSIRDNYRIYNLICITIVRILVKIKCEFFKMSKASHLIMDYLPSLWMKLVSISYICQRIHPRGRN
jgi:hypothetical protein